LRRAILYGVLVFAALYSTWPIFTMALAGYGVSIASTLFFTLIHKGPVFTGPGIRSGPTSYLDALRPDAFPAHLGNTLAVAAMSIAIALGVGVTVAYALARLPIRGKGAISYALLSLSAVFPVAVAANLYVIFTKEGLLGSIVGVALAEELVILPVVVLMLRSFFSQIPHSIYDVAAACGASEDQIFRQVALRMVIPGLVITALFAFILIWNELAIADILAGPSSKTITVGVWTGWGVSHFRTTPIGWTELNAAGFLAWIPALFLTLALKRYLAKGYSLGIASAQE
jgi:multiple sugar transport system permease protein